MKEEIIKQILELKKQIQTKDNKLKIQLLQQELDKLDNEK